ncbi:MAG: PepSY-associated TM helix domain-containing protein [Alistipes sp.]|nr:PepSY-associated TM helix domain-containing protein [Alistipes sp.]
MKSWENKATRWLRVIHRDLGYVVVGLCLVYGISGILLNHMGESDPAYRSANHTVQLPSGLNGDGLAAAWNGAGSDLPALRRIMPIDDRHSRLMLDGGVGVYDSADGRLDYEVHRKRPFVYWINKLHYSKVRGWSVMADLFAVSLLFLAVSGLFMVRGKKGLAGRGKWYLIAGLLIPVVYILLS